MHPWIAEQLNREHTDELRRLGRPFAGWLDGRTVRAAVRRRLARGLLTGHTTVGHKKKLGYEYANSGTVPT